MISDTTLTNLSNGLGVAAMLLIVVYHFVSVNGKRMEAQGGKTITDIVSLPQQWTLRNQLSCTWLSGLEEWSVLIT